MTVAVAERALGQLGFQRKRALDHIALAHGQTSNDFDIDLVANPKWVEH